MSQMKTTFSDFFDAYFKTHKNKIEKAYSNPYNKKTRFWFHFQFILLLVSFIVLFILFALCINGSIILFSPQGSVNWSMLSWIIFSIVFPIIVLILGRSNAKAYRNIHNQIDCDIRIELRSLLKNSLVTQNALQLSDFKEKIENDAIYLSKIDTLIAEAQRRKDEGDPISYFASFFKSLTVIGTLLIAFYSSFLDNSALSFAYQAGILLCIIAIVVTVAVIWWAIKDIVRSVLFPQYELYKNIVIQLKEIKTFNQPDN